MKYYDNQMVRGEFQLSCDVSQLPGCMADGRTYQEDVVNAKIIISEWIDTAKKQEYTWFLKIKTTQKKRNHLAPQA